MRVLAIRFHAALGDHLGVVEAEHFGQVLTGIGGSTIGRIPAPAVSGGAINGRRLSPGTGTDMSRMYRARANP